MVGEEGDATEEEWLMKQELKFGKVANWRVPMKGFQENPRVWNLFVRSEAHSARRSSEPMRSLDGVSTRWPMRV